MTRISMAFCFLCAMAECRHRPVTLPRPAIPSFRNDVLPVLTRHCASAEGCHGDRPTDSVALDLRPAAAWAHLVGHPAQGRAGAMRVQAGDPDASFLVDKIADTLGPREGKPMPLDAQTGAPIVPSPIAPDWIENSLRAWIRAGAPNN